MIIGLTGPAGSGKTTAANYLVERYGATRFSFAEPLKRMAMMIYGLSEAQVFGTQADKEAIDPRHGKSPRELLQFLGTDVCRTWLGPDVWANAALSKLEPGRLYVCDDVRFNNEAHAIHERGGVVVRLETGGAPASANAGHASERGVKGYHWTVWSTYGDTDQMLDALTHGLRVWSGHGRCPAMHEVFR